MAILAQTGTEINDSQFFAILAMNPNRNKCRKLLHVSSANCSEVFHLLLLFPLDPWPNLLL